MNDPQTEPVEEEVLVCGDCGRVNAIPNSGARSSSVRCSGCGSLLRGDRPRKVSIHCPQCKNRLEAEPGWLGHNIICGACSHEFLAFREEVGSLPGPSGGGVPLKTSQRVGQPDIGDPPADGDEEEEIDAQGRRRKVRRMRKRKRVREKSMRELAFFIAATVATFGVIGVAITEVGRRSGWWLQEPVVPEARSTDPAEPSAPVMEPAEDQKVEAVLGQFYKAANPEDALSVLRFPSEIGERLRAYYRDRSYQPWSPRLMRQTARHSVGDRLFLRFDGTDETGGRFTTILERVGPGEFLVDWDSQVRFASTNWDTFAAKRESTPQRFQLLIKRDFVGNPHYPLESHTAFLAYWNHENDGLPLFVPRDSEIEKAMLAASEPQRKIPAIEPAAPAPGAFPMTLEVFFRPEANGPGQVPAIEAGKFFHDGWVDLRPGRE